MLSLLCLWNNWRYWYLFTSHNNDFMNLNFHKFYFQVVHTYLWVGGGVSKAWGLYRPKYFSSRTRKVTIHFGPKFRTTIVLWVIGRLFWSNGLEYAWEKPLNHSGEVYHFWNKLAAWFFSPPSPALQNWFWSKIVKSQREGLRHSATCLSKWPKSYKTW